MRLPGASSAPPNPRLQRTRAARSPLMRQPLGEAKLGCSRKATLAGLVGGVLIFACGCRPHTWVGMNYYYPPGSQPPAAQYHLAITIHGAAGRAYVDRTEKTVYISITGGSAPELSRKYTLTAADLEANVVWDKLDDLHVDLVDETPGVTSQQGSRKSQLLTLHFAYDSHARQFTEALLGPEAVSTPVIYSTQPK